ncbi:hypothetical protein CRUP_006140 [Coryphaenoides rupestris]|nr:hypothetical protein CRUP_006140 [Coryphaenoides rupestris]
MKGQGWNACLVQTPKVVTVAQVTRSPTCGLLRSQKLLCSVSGVELPRGGDSLRLTQPLSWLPPGELGELLRSLHAHSLGNDEVLLLRDSRRPGEGRIGR